MQSSSRLLMSFMELIFKRHVAYKVCSRQKRGCYRFECDGLSLHIYVTQNVIKNQKDRHQLF